MVWRPITLSIYRKEKNLSQKQMKNHNLNPDQKWLLQLLVQKLRVNNMLVFSSFWMICEKAESLMMIVSKHRWIRLWIIWIIRTFLLWDELKQHSQWKLKTRSLMWCFDLASLQWWAHSTFTWILSSYTLGGKHLWWLQSLRDLGSIELKEYTPGSTNIFILEISRCISMAAITPPSSKMKILPKESSCGLLRLPKMVTLRPRTLLIMSQHQKSKRNLVPRHEE